MAKVESISLNAPCSLRRFATFSKKRKEGRVLRMMSMMEDHSHRSSLVPFRRPLDAFENGWQGNPAVMKSTLSVKW